MYLQGMAKPPGGKIVGTRRSAGPCKEGGGGGGSRSMQQGGPVHAMPFCCHCFLEALKDDWPLCNLHSIKSGETRVCKMFPPKTRADVGMVQCVPARYGKTTWRKNRRNKEERWSMQRGGGQSVHATRRAGPCKTQVINMR